MLAAATAAVMAVGPVVISYLRGSYTWYSLRLLSGSCHVGRSFDFRARHRLDDRSCVGHAKQGQQMGVHHHLGHSHRHDYVGVLL